MPFQRFSSFNFIRLVSRLELILVWWNVFTKIFYSPLALVEKRCSLSFEDFFRSPDTRSFSITLGWWTLGRRGRKTLCDQTSQLYCSHPFYCLRFLEWVNLQVSRPFIRCCAPFNIWQSNVETEFKRWRFEFKPTSSSGLKLKSSSVGRAFFAEKT